MINRMFAYVFVLFLLKTSTGISVYETLNAIEYFGYKAEAHHVVTDDGYVLEMHRMPYKRYEDSGNPERPVVMVMHGITAASNVFLFLGPDYSIACNLADAGFDVWLGNARATKNSRFHVTLDPGNREHRMEFFDFTYDEIGLYDISGMVDYILSHTGNEKLHYIGHSQGATAFLALNTLRPEYNEMFTSVHLLAPVAYHDHFPNVILQNLSVFVDPIYRLAIRLGIVEILPPINIDRTSTEYNAADYCAGDLALKDICDLMGVRLIMKQKGLLDELDKSGGAATKQFAHFGQNIRDQKFRRYDHGAVKNLEIYGTMEPPLYNLTLITAKVTMHYSLSDDLVDERDVQAMAMDMVNAVTRKVARDSFLHADFVESSDVKELVTDYIIEDMLSLEFPSPEDNLTDSSSSLSSNFVFELLVFIYCLYLFVHNI